MCWKIVLVGYPPNSSTNDILVTLFGFALPKAKQSQYFSVVGCYSVLVQGKTWACQKHRVPSPKCEEGCSLCNSASWFRGGAGGRISTPFLQASFTCGMQSAWLARKMFLEAFLQVCMSIWELTLDPFNIMWNFQRSSSPCTIDSKALPVFV